jgi:hypothetical protein
MRHELPNGRHERRELEAICRALLRELDNDCIWLVWQVVRGHLSQFQIEQLADVDGVRDSNRWLAKDTGTVLKTARERCQRPSDCTSGRLLEKCYDRMVISSPKGQRIVGPAARPWHRVPRFYERALRVLSADTVLNFSAAPRKPGSLDKARNAALRGDLLRVSLGDACSGKHSALNNHTYFVPVSGESSPARRKARAPAWGPYRRSSSSRASVKAIEHDAPVAIGQPGARGLNVGLPHAHRHRFQAAALLVSECAVVGGQALGPALLGDEFHGRVFEVADDRVIAVALRNAFSSTPMYGIGTATLRARPRATARLMTPHASSHVTRAMRHAPVTVLHC